jgi:pimeloyl-ACP methyl ester carboxylesterase
MNKTFKIIFLLLALNLLSACVGVTKKPDLELLYRQSYLNDNATPVIIIHGLMGSTIVNAEGVEVWPKSVGKLAFSTYAELVDESNDSYQAGRLLDTLVGVDFYGTLLSTLENAGGYKNAESSSTVSNKNNRRYYVFVYDWRKSNFYTVAKLHKLIEQIRQDYQDPKLKVDIIAHSNGGLIARYYLQYGPQTEQTRQNPVAWTEGEKRIRRLAMLGTPNLGSVISVKRLYQGFDLGFRTIPSYYMANYATPFEALPMPGTSVFIDANGTPVPLDIYDADVWEKNKWSVFSDQAIKNIQSEYKMSQEVIQKTQSVFRQHLKQAYDFQKALSIPLGESKTVIALYGGDCELTESKAIVNKQTNGISLAFQKSDVENKQKNVNYEYLLMSPGDGLVTRNSQLARATNIYINPEQQKDLFDITQTTFFCEKHNFLTANPYFQNNLLYFLLH